MIFAGTPEAAVPTLEALAEAHEVVAVLTRPDAASGRGKRVAASPVAQRAAELGITTLKPTTLRDEQVADQIRKLAPDVIPIVAYGLLVPRALLEVPRHGWVNLHFSRLPRWRGAAPVQRAIMHGDSTTAVTTFELVSDLDAGPVYRSLEVPISPDVHAGDLLASMAHLGASVMIDTLTDIGAGVRPTPQLGDATSYAAKITVNDARIDWSWPAIVIHNLVRATDPAPGAWTTLESERFKIIDTAPTEVELDLGPGELAADKRHLWAGTGEGVLELRRVQQAGKKPTAGADWARGVRLGTELRFD